MDDDLVLLERWQGGDRGAGEDLFQRHFPAIYRFFEHKCRGAVDDLVQRTFYQCTRARDRFRGQSTFRSYLFAIARHELHQHLREVRRDERLDFEITSIADVVTTVATRIWRARATRELMVALASLPVEEQLLLEMSYWHDLDSTELAEVFEIPAATVRTRLFRARRALRRKLENAEIDPTADRLSASLSRGEDDEPPDVA